MWGKRENMVVHEQDPYNAEAPASALSDPITAVDSFYVRNHGPVPEIDVDHWRLVVDGLVDRPLSLTLDELQHRWSAVTVVATMQCAGNQRAGLLQVRDIPGEDPWGAGATSTATWTGVRLSDVLGTAGVQAAASDVAFDAPDVSQIAAPPQSYGASVELAEAMHGEVLLVWAMNGEPLPRVHGAPLRVVVPGHIGARSVKWVDRVTVQDSPSSNFFQRVAYRLLPAEADPDAAGPGDGWPLSAVALNSAILEPADDSTHPPGVLEVSGYAYAGQARQVVRVDVSGDEARSWVQATLTPPASPWSWQHWTARLELPAGTNHVVCRAWDSSGASQPELPRHLWNPKGYVNNSWDRIRVHCAG